MTRAHPELPLTVLVPVRLEPALLVLSTCAVGSKSREVAGTATIGGQTMLKLDREQRALLAEKIGDAANLIFGALVVGQALSGRPFSVLGAITGIVSRAVGIVAAVGIRRRGGGA